MKTQERKREINKRWYLKHREEHNAKRRALYAENIEKHRESDRQRRIAKGETMRAQSRARYAADPTSKREAIKRWRDNNREHVNANAMRRHALKLKTKTGPVDYDAVIAASRGLCGICGEPVDLVVRKNYNIDHVIPLARGGTHTQDNLQLAHKICNVKKWAHIHTGAPAALGGAGGQLM